MSNLNELGDVTISDLKAGDVIKYTANGWVNAADSSTPGSSGNPCGTYDGYPSADEEETINKTWTWEVGDGKCGVVVEHQDGVNALDEYSKLCPGYFEAGNKNGNIKIKTFDGGNSIIDAGAQQLSFKDMNNQDGVTLAELVACCDSDVDGGSPSPGLNSAIMVNFPAAGSFKYEVGKKVKVAWDETFTGGDAFDPEWNDRALFDVFDSETNAQTVEMPPGTNAAVAFFHYGLTIQPTKEVEETESNGYANATYNMRMVDNKGSLTSSPGKLAASCRCRSRILAWDDASGIGGGDPTLQEKRAPGQSTQGITSVRIKYDTSTTENPTRVTIKPMAILVRVKRCKATIGSGRVVLIPYFDDGSGFSPVQFSTGLEDYNEELSDDGGIDVAFEQKVESRELKQIMNYYATSISETLNYDDALPAEGIPVLQEALKQIFDLKQDTVTDLNYYYNQLSTIRALVGDYVAFKFGFETEDSIEATF